MMRCGDRPQGDIGSAHQSSSVLGWLAIASRQQAMNFSGNGAEGKQAKLPTISALDRVISLQVAAIV
jgi:hypothetical protein